MVCHGELARLKPSPRHLTEFYLLISAGGALGGLFVGVVAPLIFSSFLEWQIGVTISAHALPRAASSAASQEERREEGDEAPVAKASSSRKKSRAKTPAPSVPVT